MVCNHYIALSDTAKGKDDIHYSEQKVEGGTGPGLVYGEPQVILALSQTSRKTLCGQIFPNYYCCHLHDDINHS